MDAGGGPATLCRPISTVFLRENPFVDGSIAFGDSRRPAKFDSIAVLESRLIRLDCADSPLLACGLATCGPRGIPVEAAGGPGWPDAHFRRATLSEIFPKVMLQGTKVERIGACPGAERVILRRLGGMPGFPGKAGARAARRIQ